MRARCKGVAWDGGRCAVSARIPSAIRRGRSGTPAQSHQNDGLSEDENFCAGRKVPAAGSTPNIQRPTFKARNASRSDSAPGSWVLGVGRWAFKCLPVWMRLPCQRHDRACPSRATPSPKSASHRCAGSPRTAALPRGRPARLQKSQASVSRSRCARRSRGSASCANRGSPQRGHPGSR